MILEFGHTSTLRDAVDASVPGAATHDWEVGLQLDHCRHFWCIGQYLLELWSIAALKHVQKALLPTYFITFFWIISHRVQISTEVILDDLIGLWVLKTKT